MNRIHHRLCRSRWWYRTVEDRLLPWVLHGVDLGGRVLEIGPGFGPTTRCLSRRAATVTAVEADPRLARQLARTVPANVAVVAADGTAVPFGSRTFSAVVCFTMLHHVASPALQDRLFADAYRVLAPGGVFAGSDSLPSLRFRLLHLGDTMVPVEPDGLPDRLRAAGFTDVAVSLAGRSVRFRARVPAAGS